MTEADLQKLNHALKELDHWIKLIGFDKTTDSHPLKKAVAALSLAIQQEEQEHGPGTVMSRFRRLMNQLEDRFPDPEPFSSAEQPESRYIKMLDEKLKRKDDEAI